MGATGVAGKGTAGTEETGAVGTTETGTEGAAGIGATGAAGVVIPTPAVISGWSKQTKKDAASSGTVAELLPASN